MLFPSLSTYSPPQPHSAATSTATAQRNHRSGSGAAKGREHPPRRGNTAQRHHRYSPKKSSLWERRPAREWSTTPDEGSRFWSNCRMIGEATHTRRSRIKMSLPLAWVQGTMLFPAALPTVGSADVDIGIKYNNIYRGE